MEAMLQNPELMKMAMEQMRNMTPDQMRQMMELQKQMGGMGPMMGGDQMAEQMRKLNSLSPEEKERVMREAAQTRPEDFSKRAEQMATMQRQQEQYVTNASNMLKVEGNALHKRQDYQGAAEKYLRAKNNLQGKTSPEAVTLRKACQLNLSSCYLNLGKHTDCIDETSQILVEDPMNMKALYRRGQALYALHRHQEAVPDLRAALSVTPAGERGVIQEKLTLAEEALQRSLGSGKAAGPSGSATDKNAAEPVVEEVDCTGTTAGKTPPLAKPEESRGGATGGLSGTGSNGARPLPAQPAAPFAPGGMPGMPEMTPEMVKMASEMMSKMTPADIERTTRMMQDMPGGGMGLGGGGMPQMSPEMMKAAAENMKNMTPEMMKTAMESMKNMKPEDLEAINKLQQQHGGHMGPMGGASGGMSGMGLGAGGMPQMTPEMIKMATESMKNMKPEDLEAMSKMMGGGGLPEGTPGGARMGDAVKMMQENPEMLQQAMDMMSKMSPADMEAMTRMAASAGAGPGPASAGVAGPGGAPDMASMQKMLDDPDARRAMRSMMSAIDPAQLANMTGMKEEQAALMAEQMKGMSDEQFDKLLKVSQYAQSASVVLERVRKFLTSPIGIALILLLLAIVLRYFNIV